MNPAIGMISYGLDRTPGGIGRYTRELAAALDEAGVALTLLEAGGRQNSSRLVRLRCSRLLPALMTVGQFEIARAARERRLILVHDPTGNAPLLYTGAARIVTIHDAIPFIYPETSTRLDWLIHRLWLPLATRGVDRIITVSERSKADLVRYLALPPEKIRVTVQSPAPRFRPVDPGTVAATLDRLDIKGQYILFTGSFEARKNLQRLLEAFARLRAWLPQWKLVIVGARKLRETPVAATIRRLGLEPYVHVTGYVADEDLPALYSGAGVFVLPSLYEGFGLPVLEAMACGTPVVTSCVSALPEVAGDAALLVDPTAPEAIAAAMRSILEQPKLAATLRERGLARVGGFSWRRTARETIAVYEEVLGRPLLT